VGRKIAPTEGRAINGLYYTLFEYSEKGKVIQGPSLFNRKGDVIYKKGCDLSQKITSRNQHKL